jgi:site-specific DNA-methyltransferase (adenine-specific)
MTHNESPCNMTNRFVELVASGEIKVGTVLFHTARIHPDRHVTARVVSTGIKLGDRVFPSPSGAAEAVTRSPTNGWTFWRVRPSGQQLSQFRRQRAGPPADHGYRAKTEP